MWRDIFVGLKRASMLHWETQKIQNDSASIYDKANKMCDLLSKSNAKLSMNFFLLVVLFCSTEKKINFADTSEKTAKEARKENPKKEKIMKTCHQPELNHRSGDYESK